MNLRRVFILMFFAAMGALALIASSCGSDYGAGSDGSGKLELAETAHDFGDVPVGEKVEHKFTVSNGGEGTLELGDVDVKLLEGC